MARGETEVGSDDDCWCGHHHEWHSHEHHHDKKDGCCGWNCNC
jgi:hypothetical protein